MLSLDGKTAVITGASQGIGQAIAAVLFGAGVNLVLIGRDTRRLQEASSRLQHISTPSPQFIEADLNNIASLREAVTKINGSSSVIDILINCAGSYFRRSWDEATPEVFDGLIRTNLIGPYALTRLLLPRLVEARGDIVFINSSITRSSDSAAGHYRASKMALEAISDSLRAEFGENGIRVLSIYPGRTATPLQEQIFANEGRHYSPESLLQPADVANTILCCLSLPDTAEVTDLYIRPRQKVSTRSSSR